MNVVEPTPITEARLVSSSLVEDDAPVWSSSTTYSTGDTVIREHRIWLCVAATTTTVDPLLDTDGTNWADQGATNLYRPFDRLLSNPATDTGSITYTLAPGTLGSAVGCFGIEASSVQVRVIDPTDGEVYNSTRSVVDNSEIYDAWTYAYEPIKYRANLLFTDLPIFPTSQIEITVTSNDTVKIGQIVVGRFQPLGTSLTGTSVSFTDFSTKDRDDFGNAILVERPYADNVRFNFTMPTGDAERVRGIIARMRAVPAIWTAGEETDSYGTTIYGFVADFDLPLTTNRSYATLEIEGLT